MVDPWSLLTAVMCGAICFRIAVYRREGARYRPGVSWCAYALAAGAGCQSLSFTLHALMGQHDASSSPYIVIVLAVLVTLVYRAEGNVARILRVS